MSETRIDGRGRLREPGGVVAFLQNMWVRDPEAARESLARYGQRWWRRATYLYLFGGCLTGRRLKAAFGAEIDRIVWEESTQEILGNSRTVPAPQPDHIRAVLEELQPGLVLTFGRVAGDAVSEIWTGRILKAPHPAARQADTRAKLVAMAAELAAWRAGGEVNQQGSKTPRWEDCAHAWVFTFGPAMTCSHCRARTMARTGEDESAPIDPPVNFYAEQNHPRVP